jgi:hypothetical protein
LVSVLYKQSLANLLRLIRRQVYGNANPYRQIFANLPNGVSGRSRDGLGSIVRLYAATLSVATLQCKKMLALQNDPWCCAGEILLLPDGIIRHNRHSPVKGNP